MYKNCSGLPPFLWTDTVTYSGRVIKLKSDKERTVPERSDDENITGYQATIDSRTVKAVTYPVYEDEKD